MKTHDLIQGTPAWHAYRATHFNASDAPAMLGMSPYKTRSTLLQETFTGISKEVDAATQRRFDDGHRFEALARTLAEEIVGEDLYPVTGSEGKLSASFDGLTMDESIAWEHKTLNDEIRSAANVDDLGAHLHVQMEQQLMISGAEKCLFLASKWDEQGALIEEKHFWYVSNQSIRTAIVQGWAQFAVDLANYVPLEIQEKPEAKAVIELPALFLQAEGRLVNSNMEAFGTALAVHLAETRQMVYVTDQDFADADKRAKMYRETCDKLTLTKQSMLSQTVSIDEAFRMIDTWHEDLRTTALQIEKDVKKNKESKQLSIISNAKVSFSEFIADLEKGIAPIRLNHTAPNFAEAIKGKRLFSAMHDAVQTTLANTKIELSQVVSVINANLNWLKDREEFKFLLNDLQTIAYKPSDDFQLLVTSRISEHKQREAAKLEAERARIQQEEAAKAKSAQDKINADATAAKAAEDAKAAAEIKAAQDKIAAEAEAQKVAAEKLAADQRAFEQKQAAAIEPVAPAKVIYPALTAEVAVISGAKTDAPTLTLGKIGTRLGFSLTADFLRTIGFEPAGRERAATLYHESDFPAICATLIAHIQRISQPKQQAA